MPRPAANNNASGVAVMLEAIRTMQQSGYQPHKTFLFVAYSAEGLEGGQQTPQIELSWQGWDVTADTLEAISVDKLKKSGRALSLALMILGRETEY